MRKLNVLVLILFIHSFSSLAQMKWNSAYQSYINQYKDLAIEEMLKYNIPASITLAQGVFESSAGRSYLTVSGNNHFGIKCHDWIGPSIYTTDDAVNECFRAYDNALQSYEDHSKFLKNNVRYSRLFSLDRTDYRGWAYGLKACGYATNPQYAPKLIGIIELYKLYQYDTANSYDKFMAKHSTEGSRSRTGMILHPIYVYNNNYYIKARQGDTFKSIGKEIDISYRKIAKYNERNKHDLLQEGEIIYLKKKRSKADKSYKRRPHIVKPGESMYSIAQFYGMRLKNLYKKNDLTPDYQIKVGDTLRVY